MLISWGPSEIIYIYFLSLHPVYLTLTQTLRRPPCCLEATCTHNTRPTVFKVNSTSVFLLATCFAGSSLGKTLPMQAVSEVPVWTPGCYARFSRLHRVLLIAAHLWKLGNRGCTTQRLLTSPAFPHSHFQRFHRFWCADWLWRTAGAGSMESQQPPPPNTLFRLSQSWDSGHAIYCRDVMWNRAVLRAC